MVFEEFQLGPYKIVSQLGAGGFATVYRAVVEGDMGFTRDVALKVLHPHLTSGSPEIVNMLADEARLLARMRHPNIISVQWFGQLEHPRSGPVYVLVMEFVDGRPLSDLLVHAGESDGTVPLAVIVDIHAEIAKALAYAHDLADEAGGPLGLIHRDLKPDNVVISCEGMVKLLDFGIARATDRLATATKTDMTRGTVHYMSPEQVRAAKDIDFRSDLFSFGTMFWECVVGRRLIKADSAIGALYEVAAFELQPAVDQVSGVLPDAVPVFKKLLAPKPDERYSHTEDLVAALEDLRAVVKAPRSTRVLLKELVGARRPAVAPAGGTAARGPGRSDLDFPATTPLSSSVGASAPLGLADEASKGGGVPPTALVQRASSSSATVDDGEPGRTRPMRPAAGTQSVDIRRHTERRRRSGLVMSAVAVLLLAGLAVLVGPRLFRGDPSRTDPEPPTTELNAAPPLGSAEALGGVAPTPDPVPVQSSVESGTVPPPPEAAATSPAVEGPSEPSRPAAELKPRERPVERPAPDVDERPAAAPITLPPGTVRIAADYGFEAVIAGTRYTEAQARRGISLPPGDHTARLSCLSCPSGVRDALEMSFTVESGQVARRPVRFDEGG